MITGAYLDLELSMEPERYWEIYGRLCGDPALVLSLGAARLEALARLVRELCENARHHGKASAPGRLTGDLPALVFELRLGGRAFDSVAEAAVRTTGGLHSSQVVLTAAGGAWRYRNESGWNVFELRFQADRG